MSQNLVEKIAQKFAVGLDAGQVVRSGDYISIQPAHVMTHDNTGAVIPKFKSIGASKISNPRQVVFALDHNVQDTSEGNLAKYRKIEQFAKEMGIDFYPAGRGIGHQIMCEEGYAWPGTMVVASDSHSNMYGGLGCLGTPIVRTDAASLWATGRTWWQVPPVARVELTGKLQNGATGKDVIITLAGYFNKDDVLNHSVEFVGSGVATLSINDRLAIANMTTEWGALAGVFPIDAVTVEWITMRSERIAKRGLAGVPSDADGHGQHPRMNEKKIAALKSTRMSADSDASYAKYLTLDLSTVSPHVSGPDSVKKMTSVADIQSQQVKIQKAYLLSCVNARYDDLKAAASVIRGKKVAAGVELYVAAASSEVQSASEASGDWKALLDAGAKPLPPGCGPCIGLGVGLLQDGEVGISATNRNFKGRMGSPKAQAYLASPEVVAASAVAGYITAPGTVSTNKISASLRTDAAVAKSGAVRIIDGFPKVLEGELIWCHQDNMNTDGIYPCKYTYNEDMLPDQQAAVAMENYDPSFGSIAKAGDLLVGGFNFGTGSSREQAATALKYRGLRLVLAGSFNETYKRNALNNGFLAIEAPELVRDLKAQFGTSALTARTGISARIDFVGSTIAANGKTYAIGAVGVAAQELIVEDGLENWVKKRLVK